jgi:hypothetical protein
MQILGDPPSCEVDDRTQEFGTDQLTTSARQHQMCEYE